MRSPLAVILLFAASLSLAQTAPAAKQDPQDFVNREFGTDFAVDTKFPAMLGDLDGDGAEDVIIVATAKNPLAGEDDFHYRAIDPYDSYFGWGDPKTTVQFSATNAGKTRYVLIAHDWKTPKAKFVVINLPFDQISLARLKLKKKTVNALHVEELGGLAADVYWDGKKYKWAPNAFGE